MASRQVLLATTNEHKLEEVREIFLPLGIAIFSLREVPGGEEIVEPVEDAETFEGNAAIKATYYAKKTGRMTLADDSGLEVDALGGAPGIHSARYSGYGGSRVECDAANNARLLNEMRDVATEDRGARFVCTMCLAAPDGEILATVRGTFEGAIARAPRGLNGFGYDPLLIVAGDKRTSAELDPSEKNDRSHRGAAARAMAPELERILSRDTSD